MINILDYSVWLTELGMRVNALSINKKIEKIIMAVDESQIVKRVGDEPGIVLVGSFPDADKDVNSKDCYEESNKVLLFLLQKINPGSLSITEELHHYAEMQEIMALIKTEIIQMNNCLFSLSGGIHTEWEYNAFGGFNGLSIGLSFIDYD